ncbi:MAG: hypothetical protein AMS16_00940 [Planctomycetes bacterium DG_58]|nr:MAG: hypothetical protein AMS16_00940 [Planctomycetes bacterium DG_58]
MGAAAAVSLKTTLLLVALVVTALLTVLMSAGRTPWRRRLPRLIRGGAAAIVGLLLIPTALTLVFVAKGALGAFYYGAIGHQLVPGVYSFSVYHPVLSSVAVLMSLGCAFASVRSDPSDGLTVRRTFVFLLVAVLVAALSLWPVRAKQTLVVIYPLLVVMLCAGTEKTVGWLMRRGSAIRRDALLCAIATLVALVQLGWLLAEAPWRDQTAADLRRWRQVLRLTDPSQTVMDIKGELIFRRRAYYYVLEKVTRLRLRRGLLPDDVAERLVATRTCVASTEKRGIPDASARFINENYVPVGSLLAAGKFLDRPPETASSILFDVRIPARYAMITPVGPARGTLDGKPCRGGVFLDAGPHEYRGVPGEGRLVLIWAQALERGFSPWQTSLPESSE